MPAKGEVRILSLFLFFRFSKNFKERRRREKKRFFVQLIWHVQLILPVARSFAGRLGLTNRYFIVCALTGESRTFTNLPQPICYRCLEQYCITWCVSIIFRSLRMRANFQLLSLWSITNGAPKAREILGFYTRFLWFPYYLISIYLITWTPPPGVGGSIAPTC